MSMNSRFARRIALPHSAPQIPTLPRRKLRRSNQPHRIARSGKPERKPLRLAYLREMLRLPALACTRRE